jgi:hypothetical protein
MAEQTYFERIRSRPYTEAAQADMAAAAREKSPAGPAPPWAFSPESVAAAGRVVGDVATGALMGPVDAIDTVARKVGGATNEVVARVTGGGAGFFGQPMPVMRELSGGRLLPAGPEQETLPGGFARGLTTFMTLYGPTASAIGGSGFLGEMAAGAFADMMAFENKTGTLSDALRGLGIDNLLTQSLSGELADDEWDASLRAALEGAGLGLLAPVFRGLRAGLQRWPEFAPTFMERLASAPRTPGGPATQAGMVAFHGSPHKFDAFDMSKIGTGEGAQAYGHGLYFAESPGVAGQYRDTLTANAPAYKGGELSARARQWLAWLKKHSDFDSWDEIASSPDGREFITDAAQDAFNSRMADDVDGALADELLDIDPSKLTDAKGALYTVDIPDDAVAKMLDWDRPLGQQPDSVKDAVRSWVGDEAFADLVKRGTTGKQLYYMAPAQGAASTEAAQKMASDHLRSLGIPGIRYLDAGSRGTGDGTRNIVLFDDKLAKIVKRD